MGNLEGTTSVGEPILVVVPRRDKNIWSRNGHVSEGYQKMAFLDLLEEWLPFLLRSCKKVNIYFFMWGICRGFRRCVYFFPQATWWGDMSIQSVGKNWGIFAQFAREYLLKCE